MNDAEEFEDWSHPGRKVSMPPRRAVVHWWRVVAFAIACLVFWGAWHVGHLIAQAYRTVFGG